MAMMPGQAPAAMPTEQPADQPQASGEGGYCIQICVLPDGQFSVSKGAVPQDAMGETFPDAKSAFGAALELLKANPVGGDESKDFEAGYGKQGQMQGEPGARF